MISLAISLCFVILHVENSLRLRGILNLECAVLPFCNNKAAIPDEATAKAISLLARTLAKTVLYKNVLPVPPGPSIKKIRCFELF